jgi:tetratricopeptide (TPR) repeat protein
MGQDLTGVLQAILGASTPDLWRDSLRTHGAAVFDDLSMLMALERAADRLSNEDPAQARDIRRWLEDLQQERSPGRMEQLLLAATTDEEIQRLLHANRSLVTRELGMRALREVHAMCTDREPVPPSLLEMMAQPILHRVDQIGLFLHDELLRAECKFMQSRVLMGAGGSPDAAISQLASAAQVFAKHRDVYRHAQCVGQIGTLQLQLKRYDAAEQSLRASIANLDPSSENDSLLAPTFEELAVIAGAKHDLARAAQYNAQAGEARKRQGRYDRAARAYQASAPMFLASRNERAALASMETFLSLRESHDCGTVSAEADEDLMGLIAGILSERAAGQLSARDPLTGRLPRAAGEHQADDLDRWAALARRGLPLTRNAQTRARIHFGLAALSLHGSNPASAAESARAALPFFESAHDSTSYAGVVQALAVAELRCGHPQQALDVIEHALIRLRATESFPAGLSLPATLTMQSLRVKALASLGCTRDAINAAGEALDLARGENDPVCAYYRASLTASLAAIHMGTGRLEAAVPAAIEALQMARAMGSRAGEAHQLHGLGTLCGMLREDWAGDLRAAQRWALLEAMAQQGLGSACAVSASVSRGDSFLQTAGQIGAQLLDQAIAAYRDVDDPVGEAIARGNLSNFDRSCDTQRLEALQDALARLRQAGGPPRSEAVLLANLGKAYSSLLRVADAQVCFEYSLALSDSCGDYEWAHDTATDLANAHLRQGLWADGVKYLRAAIGYTEANRRSLPLDDATRLAFARGKTQMYAGLVALHLQRDRVAEAFDVVQRAKSRALLELSAIGAARPRADVTSAMASLLQREEALLEQLRSRSIGSMSTPNADPVTRRSLPDIHADLERLYEQLRPLDPRYVAMRSGQPLRFRDLRQTLTAQGRPVLLVDYLVLAESVWVFLLRAEWETPICLKCDTNLLQLAQCRDEIERQAIRYRGRGPQTWMHLAGLLLNAWVGHLREGDLVYLVPHAQLHGIPIHAMPVRGAPLLDSHPVVYLPAASLLSLCQSARRGSGHLTSACAIGVEFEDEARAVAQLFADSKLLLGEQTSERIAAACEKRDVIHISTHGYYDPIDASKSGLVIKPGQAAGVPPTDAVLKSDEIMQMRLQSELVCLSACQSGVGRLVQGDEQLGILRAFFVAGAASVVSTLWPVDAEVTRDFMAHFYGHLLADFRATRRIDKATALQHAQREILKERGQAGMYYWAPFVLSGDWK